MFFRREKARKVTFEDRLRNLKDLGFTVENLGSGRARAVKLGCAAVLEDVPGGQPKISDAGVVVGDEIGLLVDGGYQKFFRTPSERIVPALASHLKALQNFMEDLREGLGLTSLYNQSLGTTCDQHLYDRVKDRDHGVPRRPWD